MRESGPSRQAERPAGQGQCGCSSYLAPIDAVPLITNVQYVVMLGLLLAWFFPYTARHGLRA